MDATQSIVVRAYDAIQPLARGLVDLDLDIRVDSTTPIDVMTSENPPECGEFSLSRYLIGLASGDRTWVGLPCFVLRGFRRHSFWVHPDSDLTDLSQLAGRRIGLSGWADTGNVWTRALVADAGVDLADVEWRVGPVTSDYPRVVTVPAVPSRRQQLNVSALDRGDSLYDAVLAGRVDTVGLAFPPDALFGENPPLRRLVADPRAGDVDWFEWAGVYPIFHIIVLRRDVHERHPERIGAIYRGFREAWRYRQRLVRVFGDSTPFMPLELEAAAAMLGPSVEPFDHTEAVNAATLTEFCAQLDAQGLVDRPITPAEAFADFTQTFQEGR